MRKLTLKFGLDLALKLAESASGPGRLTVKIIKGLIRPPGRS